MSIVDKGLQSEAGSRPPPLRRNRDFLLLWTGAGCFQLGARMTTVGFPLLMIWHGDSPVGAGLVSFAALLPMLILQLPAGVMVDRWDRRRLMICCDLVGITGMTTVAVAVFLDQVWLPHIMLVAFIEGSITIFYQLAERAAVRNVVIPDHLSTALSQNEARSRAAGLLGQPLGSSMFAAGRWAPFALTTAGHAVSMVTLLFIKSRFQLERTKKPRQLRAEVMEGLQWLWSKPFLRTAVTLVACSNFLFQIVNLAPFVIIKDEGGPVAAVGFIGMMGGVGGVAGALSASFLNRRMSLTAMLLSAFAVWTVLIPIAAFTTDLPVLFVLFTIMPAVGAALNVAAGVYMSQIVPDELHGRALSAVMLSSWGANSLGAMAAGFLLEGFSTTATLLGAGVAMLAITIVAALLPALRNPEPVPTATDQNTAPEPGLKADENADPEPGPMADQNADPEPGPKADEYADPEPGLKADQEHGPKARLEGDAEGGPEDGPDDA